MMIFWILAIFAISGTFSADVAPKLTGKIVGGINAKEGDAPYQVSIQHMRGHFCGGSIINARTIVSAAHCFESTSTNGISIRAGSIYHNSGGQEVSVTKIIVHPNYGSNSANDIAVLILNKDIQFKTNVCEPIMMRETPSKAKEIALVSGWGVKHEDDDDIPDILQKVNVGVIPLDDCKKQYALVGTAVTKEMMCATSTGKDSCQGDSGGPIVIGGQLAGVVSWGIGCARPGFPGVYANMEILCSWVKANMYK